MPKLISTLRKLVAARLGAQVAAVLAGVLFMIPVGGYYTRDHHGLGARTQDAVRDTRLRATLLESLIRQAEQAPSRLLDAARQGDPAEVERVASQLFLTNPPLRSVEFSRDGRPPLGLERIPGTGGGIARTGSADVPVARVAQAGAGTLSVSIGPEFLSFAQSSSIAGASGSFRARERAVAKVSLADLSVALTLEDLKAEG